MFNSILGLLYKHRDISTNPDLYYIIIRKKGYHVFCYFPIALHRYPHRATPYGPFQAFLLA